MRCKSCKSTDIVIDTKTKIVKCNSCLKEAKESEIHKDVMSNIWKPKGKNWK